MKRVRFKEPENLNEQDEIKEFGEPSRNQHTLESDEELDAIEKMSDDELETIGQESTGESFYDDIQVTPFNMNDEMEQGYFDKNGCYHFEKEAEINDAWLDNIDWANKEEIYDRPQKDSLVEGEIEQTNQKELFDELVQILNPNETVLKCIKRLGGNGAMSARDRWVKKKQKSEDDSKNKELLDKLIEIANKLLSDGVNDIYEYTREKIQQANGKEQSNMWEYKESGGEIKGPFTTNQMIELQLESKLKNAECRLIGAEVEDFLPAYRFDFELYI